jgi:hypothetical protein
MKELLHLIPSYIKDSRDLLREITTLTLPKGAGLFIADATAMYTNITLEHELYSLQMPPQCTQTLHLNMNLRLYGTFLKPTHT